MPTRRVWSFGRYDALTKGLTAFSWAVLLGVGVPLVGLSAGDKPAVGVGVFLLFTAIAVVPWGYAPARCELSDAGLEVVQHARRVVVPFDRITSVTVTDLEAVGITLRLFGSGGLYGWFGWFASEGGNLLLFSRRLKGDVVVVGRRDAARLVLAVDDAAGLGAAIEAARARTET